MSLQQDWEKIDHGLKIASVPDEMRAWMKKFFLEGDASRAKKIVEGVGKFGIFTSKDSASKARRDLCRAMNLAQAMGAINRGQSYVKMTPQSIASFVAKNSNLDQLRMDVLSKVNENYVTRPGATSDVMPKALPRESVRIEPAPAVKSMAPVPEIVKKYDPPAPHNSARAKANWKRQAYVVNRTRNIATTFAAEGNARGRINVYVDKRTGSWSTTWSTACSNIKNAMTQNSTKFMFNHHAMSNAIDGAYDSFALRVKGNQQKINSRLDLLGKLFGALQYAPPPAFLIGAIGQKFLTALHVETDIDQRSHFESGMDNTSGFFGKLSDRIQNLRESIRIGPSLGSFDNKSSVKLAMSKVCELQLNRLHEEVTETCNEHFGTTGDVLAKFEAFRDRQLEMQRESIKGEIQAGRVSVGEKNMEATVIDEIVKFEKAVLLGLEARLGFDPKAFRLDQIGDAVELMLLCNYIIALYKTEESLAHSLDAGILEFLARKDAWGVLAIGATRDAANGMRRLKWATGIEAMGSGNNNNKKCLKMFCQWYVTNINPFLMVAGATRNGKTYTPALIQELCEKERMRIISCIDKKWNWTEINAKYAALSAKTKAST